MKDNAAMNDDDEYGNESFRDSLPSVDQSGKRVWIYPKMPKGVFYNYRKYVSYVLLVFLFAAPFIKIGGQPLLLFNIIERKFSIFGLTFWPQDFFLFVLAMVAFIVFIVLFTVAFGRIFCGWFCPQTIFMEMVFRRIEYWIEGDANAQKRLDKAPWNREKILKKAGKLSIFFVISFAIGNILMAYIVGSENWWSIVTQPPAANPVGFLSVLGFSGIFFFIFTNFREQACTTVCPYGRLQGVLLDKDSIVVHYDFVRGEPRGKIRKQQPAAPQGCEGCSSNAGATATETAEHGPSLVQMATTAEAPKLGDCIDCHLCVQVCPTGIDIRNGTQLECVNCTACIDACDEVMVKVNRPKGLIRYASYNGIANKIPFRFSPKIIAYTVVLAGLILFLGLSLASRADVETTILRTPGTLYQTLDNGNLSNLYSVQLVNKTTHAMPIELRIKQPEGAVLRLVGQATLVAESQDMAKGAFFVEMPPEMLDGNKTKVYIEVYSGNELVDEVSTSFLGPINP